MSSSDESDEESTPPVDDGGLWSPDTKHKVQLSKIMIEAYTRRTGRPYKDGSGLTPIPGIASQSTTTTRKKEKKKKKAAEKSTENPMASSLMHILNQVPPIQGSVSQSTSATQQQTNRYGRTGENYTRSSLASSMLNSLTRRAPMRIPRGYYPEYLLPNSADQVPPLHSSTLNSLKRILNAPPGETFEESRRIAGSSNPRRNPQHSDNLHRPTTGEAFIEQFDRMKGKGSAMNVGGGCRQNPNTHGRNIPNANNQNQHFAPHRNNPNFYDQRNIQQQYHGPLGEGAAAIDPMQPFPCQNEIPNNFGNNMFPMQDAAQQYVIPPPHQFIPMLNAPPGPVDFQEYPGQQPSLNMAYNNMFQAGPAHPNPPAFPGNCLQNMPWEPIIDIDIPLNVMPHQWQQYPQWNMNNAGQGNAYQGFNPGYHMQHDPMNPNPIDLNVCANRFNDIWANPRRERAQNPSADHTGASGMNNQVPGEDLNPLPKDGTENLGSTVQETARNIPGSSTQASTTDNSNNDVQKKTKVGNSRSNFFGNNSEKLSEQKKSTVKNDIFATMSELFDYTLTNSIPGSSRNTNVQPNMTEDIPEIEVHTRSSEQTKRVPESSTTASKHDDSKNSSTVPAESNDANSQGNSSGPIEEDNACSLPPVSTQNVTINDDISHNAPSSSKESEEKSEWKSVKPKRQRRLRLDLGNISQVSQDEQGPSQNQNEENNQNNHQNNNQSHNRSQNSLSNNQNHGQNEQSNSKQQNKKNNVDNQQNSNNKNNRKKK